MRNVLRYFAGWWTGRPSELKPAPRAAVAGALADLAGDAETLADAALEQADEGEYRLATHLADLALEAAPDNETIRDQVATIHQERASVETDLMSRNIFSAAADYARQGRPYR
ncbi:MAG: alkyl sulfatase dimerization domain-containing protein [Natrialbaceae archaeon]|nr:alkyl sulfatase dimerization domain-containing protein [Natrialbaceae archaeon]